MIKVAHRIGTYNVEFGHPPKTHAKMILTRFERQSLDVLALVEVQDYVEELKKLVEPEGHRLVVIHNKRGSDHVAFLIRKGCSITKHWTFRAGLPYFRQGGGLMAPTQPLAVEVDGVLYVVIHAPVQAWVATPKGRKFSGPMRRRGAYAYFINRLAKLARRHSNRPLCILGDWNCTPDTHGKYSPNDLRLRVHGHFLHPKKSTGHGEIDFAIIRDLKGSGCHVIPDSINLPHSDHKLVVATVRSV